MNDPGGRFDRNGAADKSVGMKRRQDLLQAQLHPPYVTKSCDQHRHGEDLLSVFFPGTPEDQFISALKCANAYIDKHNG